MIDFTNGKVFKLSRDKTTKEDEIGKLLVEGEEVLGSYTSVRDCVIFTDKRIIAVNKQGVTGTRKDYTSLPYSKISVFSVETAGLLGYDSELELYFPGVGKVSFEFTGASDIASIARAIATFALE